MTTMKIQSSILKRYLYSDYWDRRSFLGLTIAFITSLTMATVFIVNDNKSRFLLSVLVFGIIIYALPARFRKGQCPNCASSLKFQIRTEISNTVLPSSKTDSLNGQVIIVQGWDILFTYKLECKKCQTIRTEIQKFFIDKIKAPTKSEALVLAKNNYLSSQSNS